MRRSRISFVFTLICLLSLIISTISDNSVENERDTNTRKDGTRDGQATENHLPLWSGFVGCIIASIFFGSNLIPVKQYSAGDGFFFQFVYCVAVWLVGIVLDRILDNQRFYPMVLVGGVLWTTGNLFTVFCIKTCGLAVGLLIWGTTSLIVGWASGRFGMFGVTPQVPATHAKAALNYLSVALAACSAIIFLFIKSTTGSKTTRSTDSVEEQLSIDLDQVNKTNVINENNNDDIDFPFLNRISERVQRLIGCGLAALAGVFYGLMFIPDQYIRDNRHKFSLRGENAPNNGLHYINSQYSGILLSSAFYFIIYAFFKRNKPSINPSICIPATISGAMWGIANIGFIVAISTLKNAVAYPIVSVLPGVVTSLWSLFLFREIQGRNNYILLGAGMALRITAAVLSGLSA